MLALSLSSTGIPSSTGYRRPHARQIITSACTASSPRQTGHANQRSADDKSDCSAAISPVSRRSSALGNSVCSRHGTIRDVKPRVLNGIEIAAGIKAEVAGEVRSLSSRGVTPGLAVVLVGHVAASEIYVRSKVKTCGELGIHSELLTPPESVSTEELLDVIAHLNARDEIDGILIQLPLPAHVDTRRLLEAVAPEKDVDGFHPINAGRLQSGRPALAPCTPAGILEILRRSNLPIAGQNAVVLGRSEIVGKPVAMMLLNASATVTICHSLTVDLPQHTRHADILVAAIGRPGFVTADMVKPGATLIDVGINRLTDRADLERFFPGDNERAAQFAKRGSTVIGDIDPAAFALSGAYTPVPGGVGALTIAMLMQNTVTAARARRGDRLQPEPAEQA